MQTIGLPYRGRIHSVKVIPGKRPAGRTRWNGEISMSEGCFDGTVSVLLTRFIFLHELGHVRERGWFLVLQVAALAASVLSLGGVAVLVFLGVSVPINIAIMSISYLPVRWLSEAKADLFAVHEIGVPGYIAASQELSDGMNKGGMVWCAVLYPPPALVARCSK